MLGRGCVFDFSEIEETAQKGRDIEEQGEALLLIPMTDENLNSPERAGYRRTGEALLLIPMTDENLTALKGRNKILLFQFGKSPFVKVYVALSGLV